MKITGGQNKLNILLSSSTSTGTCILYLFKNRYLCRKTKKMCNHVEVHEKVNFDLKQNFCLSVDNASSII